jgi:hypothetical protein
MEFLNTTVPLVATYDPNNPSIRWTTEDTASMTILRKVQDTATAWYCLFSCRNSFKVYNINEIVPPDILLRIRAGEVFLVLDNSLEPFLDSVDGIYENLVVKENIPEEQIILLTVVFDMADYVSQIADKLNKKPIKVLWCNVFEYELNSKALHVNRGVPLSTLRRKEYPKKFLNLNRRWRLHRPFLTALLYKKKLLDNGYVSFGPCDAEDNWDKRWQELTHYYQNDQETMSLLKECEGVKTLPPLYLDTDELFINRADLTKTTDQYYLNSYFSVVSETTFHTRRWYPKVRFLSEKIYKAITCSHPFVLVSVPHSLDAVRSLGYRTFSGIIDESYDLELDDGKRMIMIANEIERLCNLTTDELCVFLEEAVKICRYNHTMLITKNSFSQPVNYV